MIKAPRRHHEWLIVPYDDVDPAARVEMGLAFGMSRDPAMWVGAFLDWMNGERVAQIRPPAELEGRRVRVWLRVNGVQQLVGEITL